MSCDIFWKKGCLMLNGIFCVISVSTYLDLKSLKSQPICIFNAQCDGHQMTFSWLETLFKITNLGIMYQDSIYRNICISNCLSHFKPLLLWWHRCTSMWWYCFGKWALVIYLSVNCEVCLYCLFFFYKDNLWNLNLFCILEKKWNW